MKRSWILFEIEIRSDLLFPTHYRVGTQPFFKKNRKGGKNYEKTNLILIHNIFSFCIPYLALELDEIFSLHETRHVRKDGTITFKGKEYKVGRFQSV